MKIILVMVATINGKTTNGTTPGTSDWASAEDQDYFFKTIKENNLLIMGRKTYETAKDDMQINSDRLRIIQTSHPEIYQDSVIPNQLEFSASSPQELVRDLERRGYKQALLLGGEVTNTAFLKERLVNEIWLTIEPVIFGHGNNLVSESQLNCGFSLSSFERLNEKGTLLLKYCIVDQ